MNDKTGLERVSLRAWLALTILVACYLAAMIDRSILSMLIGPIKRDLNIGDFQASLLMGTAFGICYVLFGVPFGWAADRLPRRFVIAGGLAFWSLACALGGFVSGFTGLFISRMLVGIGEASLSPSAYSLLTELFGRRTSLAMAIYHYAGSVGGAAALWIGGTLLADSSLVTTTGSFLPGHLANWQIILILIAIPGVPLALLALTLPEPRAEVQSGRQATGNAMPLLPFIRSRALLITCHFSAFSLVLVVVYSTAYWLPELLRREHGLGSAEIGRTLALVTLGGALAGQTIAATLIPALAVRGKTDAALRAFLAALFVAVGAAIFAFTANEKNSLIGGVFILGACVNPLMTYGSTALQQFVPNEVRGRMSGLFLSVTSVVGLGIGPAVVGFTSEYLFGAERLGTALLTVCVTCLLGAIALLLIALKHFRAAILAPEQASN